MNPCALNPLTYRTLPGDGLVRHSRRTERSHRGDLSRRPFVSFFFLSAPVEPFCDPNCRSRLHRILWPFAADQPHNAVHVSETLGIGYELLEVRSGHGLKPIFRTGYTPKGTIDALKREAREVLGKAFGEAGKTKRARIEALREEVMREWDVGGAARRDAETFLGTL